MIYLLIYSLFSSTFTEEKIENLLKTLRQLETMQDKLYIKEGKRSREIRNKVLKKILLEIYCQFYLVMNTLKTMMKLLLMNV
jgi:hypothetical protein